LSTSNQVEYTTITLLGIHLPTILLNTKPKFYYPIMQQPLKWLAKPLNQPETSTN
jgi:hypothetical protein